MARLPVRLQSARTDVLSSALRTLVRSLVRVQTPVQLEVDELRELRRTQL